MRHLVAAKDIAIDRLSEDRDQLKVKLTLINNSNIELTQQLKRISSQKQEPTKSKEETDQLMELRAKCDQLEAINKHLKQHLNTMKKVFNELHNSSESSANQTTTTTNTTSTSNRSDMSNTLVNDKTTDSNRSENLVNVALNPKDNESCDETSRSSFDKWYNK